MKRVLVTGARGFIGQHCLPALLQRGFEIHAVSSRPVADGAGEIRWHQADLLEPGSGRRLWARVRPTHLLHLAWYAIPADYRRSLQNLPWVSASLELAAAAVEGGGGRLVFAGTCLDADGKPREDGATANLYRDCKSSLRGVLTAADQALSAADVDWAWARIFYPYGVGEPAARLVSSVIRALLRGAPAACSSGRQERDFIYVEDVASALTALVDSRLHGSADIGCGAAVRVVDLVAEIGRQMGRDDLLRMGVRADSPEPARLVADSGRLRRELGWAPRFTLESGLRRTISWWREQAAHAVERATRG